MKARRSIMRGWWFDPLCCAVGLSIAGCGRIHESIEKDKVEQTKLRTIVDTWGFKVYVVKIDDSEYVVVYDGTHGVAICPKVEAIDGVPPVKRIPLEAIP